MKKKYESPEINSKAYAQFENVYTDGCTKNKTGQGWQSGCYYDPNLDPNSGPSQTSRHTGELGS